MKLVPRQVRLATGTTIPPQLPEKLPEKKKKEEEVGLLSPAEEDQSSSKEVGDKNGNKKRSPFEHGNYDRYYGYRRSRDHGIDYRLRLFHSSWFENKRVLDIGCNLGLVPIGIGLIYRPAAVLGIDLDARLISDAKLFLENKRTQTTQAAQPEKDASQKSPENFLGTVSFRTEDFVSMKEPPKNEYDVILCLSVTKWIHVQGGDEALRTLFRRIFEALTPNGILILEPQPWSSYAKLKWKRPFSKEEIKEKLQSIKMKPTEFPQLLLSVEIGFQAMTELTKPELSSFKNRPVYVFHKSKPTAATFHPPPSVEEIAPFFSPKFGKRNSQKEEKDTKPDEAKITEPAREEDGKDADGSEETNSEETKRRKKEKKKLKKEKKKRRKLEQEAAAAAVADPIQVHIITGEK